MQMSKVNREKSYCFCRLKPITWYIEMHRMRAFFLRGIMTFSNLVMLFTTRLSSRGKLTVAFVCCRTVSMVATYQLKIKYVQD